MKQVFVLTLMFCCMVTVAFAATGKAVIKGTAEGSPIAGTVDFSEGTGGLTVRASVSNVPPGKHGFHIHENGSCAEGGKAAGGHFNPDKVAHGFFPQDGPTNAHAGDMGNIDVDAQGNGTLALFMPGLTLADGKYAVAGKAVILHEKVDDFTQPTGNAGGRIGCGVIEVVQPAQ